MHVKCRQKINIIMEENSLIDAWRSKNPGKLQYTWHSKVEEPRKVTIYMAFIGRRT